VSKELRANTDELRKEYFADFVSQIAQANGALQDALAANPNPVPSNRCDSDKDIDDMAKAAKERAEVIMKALGGIVGADADGVKSLAAIFDKVEDENQELGYDKPVSDFAKPTDLTQNIHK
jgi:hypothetical protein